MQRSYLWTFFHEEGVEPTNNLAERAFRSRMILKGSVEKIAFFDASGLYALNRQQEVLNRILFIFSNL